MRNTFQNDEYYPLWVNLPVEYQLDFSMFRVIISACYINLWVSFNASVTVLTFSQGILTGSAQPMRRVLFGVHSQDISENYFQLASSCVHRKKGLGKDGISTHTEHSVQNKDDDNGDDDNGDDDNGDDDNSDDDNGDGDDNGDDDNGDDDNGDDDNGDGDDNGDDGNGDDDNGDGDDGDNGGGIMI
ncbi:hypothetical protein STEG23_010644 [Scotinomys teguina]